jgi:hypothetical protein
MENFKRRKTSTLSRHSTSAPVAEFVTAKLHETNADARHLLTLHNIAENTLRNQTLGEDDYDELISAIKNEKESVKIEIQVVKKQHQAISFPIIQ